jgi:hypothetical protein
MTAPDRYHNVSQSQMSVARYYGGMTVNGQYYAYDPTTDTLVRQDVVKREAKAKKRKKKPPTVIDANGMLFGLPGDRE